MTTDGNTGGGALFGASSFKDEIIADFWSRYYPAQVTPGETQGTGLMLMASEDIIRMMSSAVTLDIDEVAAEAWRRGFKLVLCKDGLMRWAMRPKTEEAGR